MEILKFIFEDFWHFLGCITILEIIFEGFYVIIKVIMKKHDTEI